MVLAGYTGLVSLGHAAFLGIGGYAHVYFAHDLGLPWIVSVALAAAVTAAAGVLVGLPALRMTGVYLTNATLAFALIIQEVFTRWEHVTGGLKGKPVDKPVLFGVSFAGDAPFYFLCLGVLLGGLWLTRNLKKAQLVRAKGIPASYELFMAQKLEALGGLKPKLVEEQARTPGSRVLEGQITGVQQSIAAPKGRPAAAEYMRKFADDVRKSGLAAKIIEKHGVRGVIVAK
jgi:branched-subunit amino acid ABC-type transport system permease component